MRLRPCLLLPLFLGRAGGTPAVGPAIMPMPPLPPMLAMPPMPLMPWVPRMPLLPQAQQLLAGAAPSTTTTTSGAADMASFYDNFLSTLFMAPGATGMKLPLVPSQPMISGLPGMAARRGNYFGPHWDTQVTRTPTPTPVPHAARRLCCFAGASARDSCR